MGSAMSIADLKIRLRDLPGVERLTMQMLAGRQTYSLNGHVIALHAGASDGEAEKAIRDTISCDALAQMPAGTPIAGAAQPAQSAVGPSAALLPPITTTAPQPTGKPMTPAPGSFAASLKSMMDEARANIDRARADGTTVVKDAVAKLDAARAATTKVADNIAHTIEDEAAAVMAELGQISNDLGA
jgi:hypothetical protein